MARSYELSERLLSLVFYLCSVYFLLMGALLLIAPHVVTNSAGPQHPLVLGMLRGAGGSIIPYSLLYFYVARKPRGRLWATYVIGLANVLAIAVDLFSVHLGEYSLSNAMIDVPVEALSLFAILLFQWQVRRQTRSNRPAAA